MGSSNEAEDPEERRAARDYCYEDFDASLSDDGTNVATLSSCSSPSSLATSSRGPPSVATCDEIRSNDHEEQEGSGPLRKRSKSISRHPVKRKKKNHVSSATSPAITANGSDKSSE